MHATDRIQAELAFHRQQTVERAAHFLTHPDRLIVNDDWYLDHATWIRPAIHALGDLSGLSVLDYGCGHGMASVVQARRGARVTAFDLSPGYVAEAQRRAAANDLTGQITVVTAAAERLPFDDDTFDRVWGNAILHHVQLEQALPELRRVLKPGGRAVFCEPWGGNPLLNFIRAHVPYPGKERSRDERPFQRTDLISVAKVFPSLRTRHYQLLGMVQRLTGPCWLASGLDAIDERLLTTRPWLGRFSRYVVLSFRK